MTEPWKILRQICSKGLPFWHDETGWYILAREVKPQIEAAALVEARGRSHDL